MFEGGMNWSEKFPRMRISTTTLLINEELSPPENYVSNDLFATFFIITKESTVTTTASYFTIFVKTQQTITPLFSLIWETVMLKQNGYLEPLTCNTTSIHVSMALLSTQQLPTLLYVHELPAAQNKFPK